MVQTRAQDRGAPLKKEGAYNTDAYYQELDQGFGDVGVDQVGPMHLYQPVIAAGLQCCHTSGMHCSLVEVCCTVCIVG
jgi:hypothetical protein